MFQPLYNNMIALNFLNDWLEIWDLDTITCNLKIAIPEKENIYSIDQRRIIVYSDSGLTVIHL